MAGVCATTSVAAPGSATSDVLTVTGSVATKVTVGPLRGTLPAGGRRFGVLRPFASAVTAFDSDGKRYVVFTQDGSVQVLVLAPKSRLVFLLRREVPWFCGSGPLGGGWRRISSGVTPTRTPR